MTGFIKCDICGKFYKRSDNVRYDGLAAFYYGSGGPLCHNGKENIIERNGDDSGIPTRIDMCNGCFDKFVNWIKLCRADAGVKDEEND